MRKMKLVTVILFIGITTEIFGQSKPDQKLLSKDYLWGKTPAELRIMRNEIFARYGFIFNSKDLKDYFLSQKWYKPKYENVNEYLTDIDKENIALIADFEKNEASKYTSQVYDSSVVKSIKVSPVGSPGVFCRQIEVTYPEYNWKKTVERFSWGAEDVPTTITIEYLSDSPYNGRNLQYWEMKKYVDDLEVHYDYLQTKDYDIVDHYNEIFPFFQDEPVVCYDGNKFFKFRVPNSKVANFWIGYSYTAGKNDNGGAKIYLSDMMNGIINELLIISNSGRIGYLEDDEFKIITSNPRDKLDSSTKNTYELWSSEKSESRSNIKEFKIVINGVFNIEIPVINGYLYGNSDKKQTMVVE